jgi:hypothetical protein
MHGSGKPNFAVAYLEGAGWPIGPPMQILTNADLHPLGLTLTHWGYDHKGLEG